MIVVKKNKMVQGACWVGEKGMGDWIGTGNGTG